MKIVFIIWFNKLWLIGLIYKVYCRKRFIFNLIFWYFRILIFVFGCILCDDGVIVVVRILGGGNWGKKIVFEISFFISLCVCVV